MRELEPGGGPADAGDRAEQLQEAAGRPEVLGREPAGEDQVGQGVGAFEQPVADGEDRV